MFFEDWKTNENYNGAVISPTLLWEYDLSDFDWDYMRRVVVERVLERGDLDDFYAAICLYGGLENFIKIIKDEVMNLSEFDMNFVCFTFHLKKEELKCYTRKQSREALFLS